MSNQPSLFDVPAAIEARDQAIEQVDTNASPEWKQHAIEAVKHLARMRPEFTTDDVHQYLADRGVEMTHEPRALGAVMVAAARARIIAPTDRYTPSARPECHRRPVKIWRSL